MELPKSIYLPEQHEPAGVLPWGKAPGLTDMDLAAGVARIGGWRDPSYPQAYLTAAHTLFNAAREKRTLDHHGLPIFYLQRHAAELIIKSPLKLGIDIQDYREKLGKPRPNFPSNNQRERSGQSHDLGKLLADLEAMTVEMKLAMIPEQLRSVVKKIEDVEQKTPEWSRYSFHMSGSKGARTPHWHMREEIVIPLCDIQNQLQAASNALGLVWEFHDGLLMGQLWDLYEHLSRAAGEID